MLRVRVRGRDPVSHFATVIFLADGQVVQVVLLLVHELLELLRLVNFMRQSYLKLSTNGEEGLTLRDCITTVFSKASLVQSWAALRHILVLLSAIGLLAVKFHLGLQVF